MKLQTNEKGFKSFELRSGSHGHKRAIVWVNNRIPLDAEGDLMFPVRNAQITVTEKGTLVMKPVPGIVYLIRVVSGYRGSASIDTVEGGDVVVFGNELHSGQGSLGYTAWALVNAPAEIEVKGSRTGRRVDNTNVHIRIFPDGREENVNLDELADELA